MSRPHANWEQRADAVLGIAASLILFLMMLLTFVDVVARYLFNFPLRGGFEVTELMLLVLIFAGLPLVSHADEHVTMDFIDRVLPEGARQLLVRVVHAICGAYRPLTKAPSARAGRACRIWATAGSPCRGNEGPGEPCLCSGLRPC